MSVHCGVAEGKEGWLLVMLPYILELTRRREREGRVLLLLAEEGRRVSTSPLFPF